jgi:membrane protein required for colicin V production
MPSFNAFDVAVYACLLIAFIMGFNSGLLRSLATIFGYLVAMAVAVAAAPFLTRLAHEQWHLSPLQNWMVLVAVFVVAGVIISAMLRYFVSEMAGSQVGPVDRVLGAIFGIVRIVLLAVLIVIIFDRIIPPGREPAFIAESKLRPILSAAGRQGLRSLPLEIEGYINRLKRERGL